MADDRWLGTRNRYRRNTVDSLRTDTGQGGTLNSKHIAEYMAASAPIHCLDGWAFLGRALGCHLMGDADSSRHLGYYAELRAAAALLATTGIGVFEDRHIVIDSAGNARRVGGRRFGTHAMMWLALQHWATTLDAVDVLGQSLRPAASSLGTWIANMPQGSTWQPIGRDWLLSLGLDLERLADDREARNEASYRPTYLTAPSRQLDARGSATFAVDLWSLFEPSGNRAFDQLDLHFLRQTLEHAFQSVLGLTPRQAPRKYEGSVVAAVDLTLGNGGHAHRIRDFLLRRESSQDPELFTSSRRTTDRRDPQHHMNVMSRATLLLRIATGSVRTMLDDAGIPFEDAEFWWLDVGERRGLWQQPPSASTTTDLWADFRDAIDVLNDWVVGTPQTASYWDFKNDCGASLSMLGGAETAGLWGLVS